MKRPVIVLVVALLVAGACGGDGDSSSGGGGGDGGSDAAASPFTPAPPEGSADIPVEAGSYNYSPAVLDEGDTIKAWWCSATPDAATDNIWYQEYDKKTKQATNRKSVLQVGKPGDWDTFGVCHPTVIKGEWPNPAGGAPFTYAMYYTSTNVAQGGGSNNSTGVVFSTDGVTWARQHDRINPNITQKVPNVPDTYGAGLPSAWSRGGSKVTLFWIDTTWERSSGGYRSRGLIANSDDGINFGAPTVINNIGAPAYWKNDYVLDDSSSPPMVYSTQALNFRSIPAEKSETYNFGFYRMSESDFLAGRGTWELLAYVDTNLTGLPLNFEPGISRDAAGKMPNSVEDGIRVWFGGGSGMPGTWQLREIVFKVGDDSRAVLHQYKSGATYWATTGYVPPAFASAEAETLGVLDVAPSDGTVPLYGCQRGALTIGGDGRLTGVGADRFVALAPPGGGPGEACGDANQVGVNGFLFSTPPTGTETKPIYACKDGNAQFLSNAADCGGKTVEGLLGHARAS